MQRHVLAVFAFVFWSANTHSACGPAASSWLFPTTQDNTGIFLMRQADVPLLVVPTWSNLQVIYYKLANFGKATPIVLPAGYNPARTYGMEDTASLALVDDDASPSVAFADLIPAGADYAVQISGVSPFPAGTTPIVEIASPGSALVTTYSNSMPQVSFARPGHPAAVLAAVAVGFATFAQTAPQYLVALRSSPTQLNILAVDKADGHLSSSTPMTTAPSAAHTLTSAGLLLGVGDGTSLVAPGGGTLFHVSHPGESFVSGVERGGTVYFTTEDVLGHWRLRRVVGGAVAATSEIDSPTVLECNADQSWLRMPPQETCALYDAQSLLVQTGSFFGNNDPSGLIRLITTPDGRHFAAKALFYYDGVDIREINASSVDPNQSGQTAAAVFSLVGGGYDFGAVEPGAPVVGSLAVRNLQGIPLTLRASVVASYSAPTPAFEVMTPELTVPSGETGHFSIRFNPVPGDASLSYLRVFAGSWNAFSGAVLTGRSKSPAPALLPSERALLFKYLRSTKNYLTDSRSYNTLAGLPCSKEVPGVSQDRFAYCVPHEIGLDLLVRALLAAEDELAPATTWPQVLTTLTTLEAFQHRADLFILGSYTRFLEHRNPDGSNRAAAQVLPDTDGFNEPSSDDNALLACSLLLVRDLAEESGQMACVNLITTILGRLDLRRFLSADGLRVHHWRKADGTYSAETWDGAGTESKGILTAMVLLRQLTTTEYGTLAGNLDNRTATWGNGRIFIPSANYHGASFMPAVSSQAGLAESPGATAWGFATVLALLDAQVHYADMHGQQVAYSHVMSQTLGGGTLVGDCPGNYRGEVCAPSLRTGPHAFFLPLSRLRSLPLAMRSRLFAMMAAYEPLYWTAARGWEAGVPLTVPASYVGTDEPHATEALNNYYIILSILDALRGDDGRPTLAEGHPYARLNGLLMDAAQSDGTLPDPLLVLMAGEQTGGTRTLGACATRGPSIGQLQVERAANPAGPYLAAPAVIDNTQGGVRIDAVLTPGAANPEFYRLRAP